ncbi:MAG: GyrI-like domain-containing protein [Hyphomicrobiaceae bacterium]
MAKKLVYLRSIDVAYFRVTGPRSAAADLAWHKMIDWLEKYDLRNEVERGYGICQPCSPNGKPGHYDACVALPPATPEIARSEVKIRKIPGGAYTRWQHKGAHSAVQFIISDLQDCHDEEATLTFDPTRPTIEIFLNDPAKVPEVKLRTDICLPVALQTGTNGKQFAA